MSTKKSSIPDNDATKTEYTRSSLIRLSREEVNEVALSFNIKPRRFPNKELLADAIMLEVYNGDDNVDSETGVNPKQELFCQLYCTDREFFGNGTQSYIEAYDVDMSVTGAYKSAQAAASRLLSNVIILKRIDFIREQTVMNDQLVDKKTAFWITQEANPMASIAAIKEYNKVKNRVDSKLALLGGGLTQNNYNININDARGKEISQKYTQAIEAITMEETPPEVLAAARSVPPEVVSSY